MNSVRRCHGFLLSGATETAAVVEHDAPRARGLAPPGRVKAREYLAVGRGDRPGGIGKLARIEHRDAIGLPGEWRLRRAVVALPVVGNRALAAQLAAAAIEE